MSSKDTILRLLEENRGRYLSGNELSEQLGISRTAVWKAVRQLEEEGYTVLAVNKKGYQLAEDCDILSSQSIRPFLRRPELYPDIQVHKLLESTNKTAKELANHGASGGTVVLAEQQSGGRGRLGRSFYSPSGAGIYMTVLLRPTEPAETTMLITSAAAVAVCRALKAVCGLEAQIKWVNDVYLDGRKLCGILTEAAVNFEDHRMDYLIIGIGINVTNGDFPPELREAAISLEEKLGRRLPRSPLIGELLNQLSEIDLSQKQFLEEYRARSFVLGSYVNVISPTGTERALAVNINDQGHLLIRLDDGTEKALSSGEISIRKV